MANAHRRTLRLVPLLGAIGLLGGCAEGVSEPSPIEKEVSIERSETDRLNAWFDEKYEEQLEFMPMSKTYLGIKDEDYGKLNDYSDAGAEAFLEWRRAALAEMSDQFDYDALDPVGRDSFDLWAYITNQTIEASRFRDRAFIYHQFGSAHSSLPQFLISRHDVATEADMNDYISRIRETGRAIRQLTERSRRYAAAGVRPPYFAFERVIEEATSLSSGAPFDESGTDSPIWADVVAEVTALETNGAVDAKVAQALLDTAREALLDHWAPAYEELVAWQTEDRVNALPDSDAATGVGVFPGGDDYYVERLKYYTTTDLSADDVHELGLANVARLRLEMESFQADVGIEGTLDDFFTLLQEAKDDQRFYFPNTVDGRVAYLEGSRVAIENIDKHLPDFFGLLPKADVVVKRVEAFREQAGAAAHYFPSSPDGTRPGVFYAHLLDMMAMPKYRLENLAYHEALPGHHLQIAIANELQGIPEFRKRVRSTAYTEGWGLYAERLAKEIPDTYQDPFGDFGRLRGEIWRAVRLVVDTGLHAKGWSEQRAIEYCLANAPVAFSQAQSEVRRYIVIPGQATAYMVGMLKMLELRETAEDALGESFDIRAFHDTILGQGAMPLNLLEQKVERWIAAGGP